MYSRLSRVDINDRGLLRGLPSIRIILNECVEYNIVFYSAFITNFITQFRYVTYVELFESVKFITFVSYI